MSNLHSIADAARQITKEIGGQLVTCPARTLRRICAANGIGAVVGRSRVLTEAEIDQARGLYRGQAGNPNWRPK